MSSTRALPNFLFIGPDKSGSTWIYDVLSWHPQVFMSQAKELFFFDYYYRLGMDWYLDHFKDAGPEHRVVGEVSHDYLYSAETCRRIAEALPDVKLMACLREPVERAFSSYLYMYKQGRVNCSFDEAIGSVDELVEHGLYGKLLEPYIQRFDRSQIHVALFDDLQADANAFAQAMFDFLAIDRMDLPERLLRPSNAASRPRLFLAAKLARRVGVWTRDHGMPEVVGRVKSSPLVQRTLYREYTKDDRPRLPSMMREGLRYLFREDVERLSELLGVDMAEKWGYRAQTPKDETLSA